MLKKQKERMKMPPRYIKTAIVIVMLGILIMVNMISNLAVDKFSLKFDMTATTLYEFSDVTRHVV